MYRICVVGTWHQASIVSACFADMGHQVFGVGDNPNEIESLNAAKPLVREPKLQAIIRRNLRAGRLHYTTDYAQALKRADFVYVSDVVRANLLALENGNNGVYNLGWGVGVSVNEIFRRLKVMTDYPLDEVHGPSKPGEVRYSYLDANKARRKLGWEPLVNLGEGLRYTVDFFRPVFTGKHG